MSLSELPLAQLLGTGETARVEEVVLSVPDGGAASGMINTRPMRGEGVRSMVVTMQDLASLDEIDRMRTGFLGLVSHESPAPLIAIKGSDALLEEAELEPGQMREFFRIIAEQTAHRRGPHPRPARRGAHRLGYALGRARALGGRRPGGTRPRTTFVSGGGRYGVLVVLPAGLPPVMADRRRIVQVLARLFANANQVNLKAALKPP